MGKRRSTCKTCHDCSFFRHALHLDMAWIERLLPRFLNIYRGYNEINMNFPQLSQGKYCVIDEGYPTMRGYLAPYKIVDIIYRSKSRVCCSKEIFNYVHSSLGNIIERCFHVLKVHFLILKRITPYSLQTQVLIVVLAASYNCIRHEM